MSTAKPCSTSRSSASRWRPSLSILSACLIGMEACGSAHHWACAAGDGAHRAFDGSQSRQALRQDHQRTMRLMRQPSAKPSLARACASCPSRTWNSKACSPCTGCARVCQGPHRPGQPDPGLAGRVRADRPAGHRPHQRAVPQLIEDACNELPGAFRCLIQRLLEHLKRA